MLNKNYLINALGEILNFYINSEKEAIESGNFNTRSSRRLDMYLNVYDFNLLTFFRYINNLYSITEDAIDVNFTQNHKKVGKFISKAIELLMTYEYSPARFLDIKESEIEGRGLFTNKDLQECDFIGISHVKVDDEIIRTGIGDFYNHSENPNCEKVELEDRFYLRAIKDIKKGEELTVKYTFYSI